MTSADRRKFLKLIGLSATAAALPSAFLGCRDDAEAFEALADTGPELSRALPKSLHTWSREELDVRLNLISGRLPSDLSGHGFIVGALPYPDETFIFNGDGLVFRVDLDPAGVGLKSKMMHTPCRAVDLATQDNHPWGFVNLGIVRLSSTLGIRNQLNTAFQPCGDRMLVTYDGGRPYELDVNTLELITPVGAMDEWRDSIPFVQGPFKAHMSTAHPYWDEHTNELFSVNFGSAYDGIEPFTDIVRWDGEGRLQRWTLIDEATGKPAEIVQSAHQMTVSEDFVILVDCAFLVEEEQFFDPNVIRAQEPDAVVYIVSRADLKAGQTSAPCRRLVIPREIVHFIADYENPGGKITLHVIHNCATDASEWVRAGDTVYGSGEPVAEELVGFLPAGTDVSPIGRHVIDGRSGELVESRLFSRRDYWSMVFFTHKGAMAPGRMEHMFFNASGFHDELLTSRIVEVYRDYPHRSVPVSELGGWRPAVLMHFDPVRVGVVDAYAMPPGRFLGSPQFIPRRGARDGADGYVLCTVVSDDVRPGVSSGDELWLFNARDLASGPIARLGHPELRFGFTLHTSFLPELKARRSSYRIDPMQEFASILAEQPAAVGDFIRPILQRL